MKTLSIFTGGIGDCLLAGPTFTHLHEQGSLDLAGNSERLALIQAAEACDEVYDLDRIAFHTLFDKPSEKLREFIQQYDRVIVWMRDDGVIEQALRECGVHNVQVHPGIPPDNWTHHATMYYLQCVGAKTVSKPLRITKWEDEVLSEPNYDVIIHPGSGSPKKNWPIENFARIANSLQEAGRCVTWIRGPAEENLDYPVNAVILEAEGLMDLAKRLAATSCYIGNDSGVTHFAAAAGCKVVAVFGPTDPGVWAPRGDNVRVATGQPWQVIRTICGYL